MPCLGPPARLPIACRPQADRQVCAAVAALRARLAGPLPAHACRAPPLHPQISKEVKRFAKAVGLTCVAVYGGSGVANQITELKRGTEIVVCTPGRMIDILGGCAGASNAGGPGPCPACHASPHAAGGDTQTAGCFAQEEQAGYACAEWATLTIPPLALGACHLQ